MSDFPSFAGGVTTISNDDATGTAYKTAITVPGSANAKGAWTQLSASCPLTNALILTIQPTSGVFCGVLVDIGVGAAAAEQVLIPNIYARGNTNYLNLTTFQLPAHIPAGTRVSARVACSTASKDFYIKVAFASAPLFGMNALQSATDYGVTAASTTGVVVTASGTVNTKGSWTQITASCGAMKAALLCIGQDAADATGYDAGLDIGVGAGGSEQIVMPDLYFVGGISYSSASTTPGTSLQHILLPLEIPSGTRIAARMKASTGSKTVQCTLIGFN